jgi:hypothetical protein
MNLAQVVTALRREGDLDLRAVIARFEGKAPDVLGPPGRWPLIAQLVADARLDLDRTGDRWRVRLRP